MRTISEAARRISQRNKVRYVKNPVSDQILATKIAVIILGKTISEDDPLSVQSLVDLLMQFKAK